MTVVNSALCYPSLARDQVGIISSTITFDTTTGPVGTPTITVFTITGRVFIYQIFGHCTVDLLSAGGGTLALGVVGNTAGFIAATTATAIDAGEWWIDGTPVAGHTTVPYNATGGATAAVANKVVSSNVVATVATADITAGTLIITAMYYQLTRQARLA